MNNTTKLILGLVVIIVAAVSGVVGANLYLSSHQTGGAYAGGVTPSQLFTGNAAGNYVTPVGSALLGAPNGEFVGGFSLYNEQTQYITASGTPLAAGATLGAFGTTTSTATTSITVFDTVGLSIGAICSGGVATNTTYVSGCLLNTTNGVTGTAIVAYSNMLGSVNTVPSTTRISISFDQLPY